ncbi:hypothetical protein [Exiguobacterium antarcticum]|uniref:hypothetical protein n=1 Tax=Exiguobacterium antarcticum TaxID=132920 RepID=UPI000A4D2DA7|nr:hypothetical protein [Exiguobacterium antarcticum]
MSALLNYIYSSFRNNPQKNAFISNPPGPAILLWSNRQTHPQLSGISVVSEKPINTPSTNQQISTNLISTIVNDIRKNTSIPFLSIEYDFYDPNHHNHTLLINGQQHNVTNGGNLIASTFSLQISSAPQKAINSSASVKDPFHLWSSNLFSGTSVMKIDLDLVIVNISNNTISSMVEVKRSGITNFNAWQPYQIDYSNYAMMFSLSDALNIPFLTIHHNELKANVINPNKIVNLYTYTPNSSMDWQSFRGFSNRQQISAQQAVSQL